MALRLLQSYEVADFVLDAEEFYNEQYAEEAPFDSAFFEKAWSTMVLFGDGLIFVESKGREDRGTFGCLRVKNTFTGELEYLGSFLAIKPAHRGGVLVLTMMEEILAMIQTWGQPFNMILHSRFPSIQPLFTRLGFQDNAVRYIRRVTL